MTPILNGIGAARVYSGAAGILCHTQPDTANTISAMNNDPSLFMSITRFVSEALRFIAYTAFFGSTSKLFK